VITDGELERMRDSLRADLTEPKAAQAWATQARADLEALLELVGGQLRLQGGSFAAGLRQALEAKIIRQLNGRASLTDETRELSLLVSVTPNAVIVDARLSLGIWQQ
jgi:hypothetical protein